MRKVITVKEVGEICAGAKVKILPSLSSDHFLKVGGALEEQEQGGGGEVGCVVDPQRPHVLKRVQPVRQTTSSKEEPKESKKNLSRWERSRVDTQQERPVWRDSS